MNLKTVKAGYYLRLDPVTGFTILGTLNPVTGLVSDIANLGSVYTTLDYVDGNVGFGTARFYTTGTINTAWQSVSFAAISSPRAISAGSFTVAPSASSGLAIALTVVPGSAGSASISGPVAGVFTVTPTAPGLITLQATQAGQAGTEYNMLRQSFTATGVALLSITTQPAPQTALAGTTASFSVTAAGTALTYQWQKAGANITGNASATTATLTLANVQAADAALYDVVVSNASGSISSNIVALTLATGVPIITNSPLTAAGAAGTPFSFAITASGSPTSYAASPLPPGLSIVAATGVIAGTPTAVGTTAVLLGATNASGTGNATLTITVAAAGVAPIITNSPLTAAGVAGTPFSFAITASGSPTAYAASPLPAGLGIAAATGVITGTPTAVGTTAVLLGATNATGTGNATLTITVAAAGVVPIIVNSTLTPGGTVGIPFSYTITGAGSPTSHSASPLPAGLSIVAATGVITGTPTAPGTTSVLLGATNATGTGYSTLKITVAAAGVSPIITDSPLSPAATVGTPFSFTITAAGSPTSYAASPLPAGLSIVAATGVITGTPTAIGTTAVALGATNSAGTGNATLTVTITNAPVVTTQPASQTVVTGGTVTFTVGASGTPAPAYQWYLNGAPVSGATGATLTIPNVQAANAGSYTVSVSNSGGTTVTAAATLTVTFSRIVNISALAQAGPGSQVLTLGFWLSGSKTLLVRGDGPDLASFGIANTVADPKLTLFGASGQIATNTGWQTGSSAASIPGVEAQVGAFLLPAGGKDSAVLAVLNAGGYTAQVASATTNTGTAMVEVYDGDLNPGARLINGSALGQTSVVSGNVNSLTAGFVILGNAQKTLLIRGVGPALSAFGESGVLASPQLTVFSSSGPIASNHGWGTGNSVAQITATFSQVGAFALPSGSNDAALVITLQPGAYTVQVIGVGGTGGLALLEIYDVQ